MADGRSLLLVLVMINFFMYLMGYPSAGQNMMTSWFCTPTGVNLGVLGNFSAGTTAVCTGIGDYATGATGIGPMITGIVGIILGATVLAIAGGAISSNFGLIYTIPAFIVSAVLLGLFLTPLSFITEAGIPYPLNALIGLVFGVMLLFSMISFIRGGEI